MRVIDEKTIIISYNEYKALEERANKTDEYIREEIRHKAENNHKELQQQFKIFENWCKEEYESKLKRIKASAYKLTNWFGYIKAKDLIKRINEIEKEGK